LVAWAALNHPEVIPRGRTLEQQRLLQKLRALAQDWAIETREVREAQRSWMAVAVEESQKAVERRAAVERAAAAQQRSMAAGVSMAWFWWGLGGLGVLWWWKKKRRR